jgi:hypothetical protein
VISIHPPAALAMALSPDVILATPGSSYTIIFVIKMGRWKRLNPGREVRKPSAGPRRSHFNDQRTSGNIINTAPSAPTRKRDKQV